MTENTIKIEKTILTKILKDAEILIDDVESALNNKLKQRILDIKTDSSIGKTEKDLEIYLKKRGVITEEIGN